MDSFWVVTLFQFQPTPSQREALEYFAVNDFSTLGIEEFSLDEAAVDELLGERSYSGGDLPLEVLNEVEANVLGKPGSYRYFFSNRNDAEGFREKCRDFLAETQIEECAQEDWNAEWKKHYRPIKVNEFFEIVPSWMTDYVSTSQSKILIYPGMGFGTGSHETTFLCLKLFTTHLIKNKIQTCLDFGSGSGILGLSALKFFPNMLVDFYDIDPEANKNCFQNAQLNQLEKAKFRLLLPEVRDKLAPTYDVVFANILESILLAEKSNLIGHTKLGGHLILSGLLSHQVPNVLDAYEVQGLTVVERADKGDWSAIILRKDK